MHYVDAREDVRERLSSFLLALLNRSASFPHRVWWPFLFSWFLARLQKAEVGPCTDAMTTPWLALDKVFSLWKISHEHVKDVY